MALWATIQLKTILCLLRPANWHLYMDMVYGHARTKAEQPEAESLVAATV